MSRIHISIELDSTTNESAFIAVLAALGQSNATIAAAPSNIDPTPVEDIKVVDAEEVKPAPTAKPRPSRAKAKPEPVVEEEEAEEEDEPQTEAPEDADFDDEETEAIGIEDVRAKQAEKIGKHKPAIIEALKSFGATGISSLDAKHYAAYFDALSKLK